MWVYFYKNLRIKLDGNGGFLDRGVSSAKGGKKLVSINFGKADLRKSTDDAGLN